MAEIWFISDTHFGHLNIIKYSNRPFRDVVEMDEFMIHQWNIYVRPEAHVYHLGDVTIHRDGQGRGLELLKRCNGHKRLIMGNHDHYPMKFYLQYFEKVMAMNRFDGLWMTHVPVHPSSLGSCTANIHGHTHAQPDLPPVVKVMEKGHGKVERVVPYLNICVERTDYHPVSLEWLKEKVKKMAT